MRRRLSSLRISLIECDSAKNARSTSTGLAFLSLRFFLSLVFFFFFSGPAKPTASIALRSSSKRFSEAARLESVNHSISLSSGNAASAGRAATAATGALPASGSSAVFSSAAAAAAAASSFLSFSIFVFGLFGVFFLAGFCEDVLAQPMRVGEIFRITARCASRFDVAFAGFVFDFSLSSSWHEKWISAARANDVKVDEFIESFSQKIARVFTFDDNDAPLVIVARATGSKLKSEEFGCVDGADVERAANIGRVHDDSSTIDTSAFNFELHGCHLMAGVGI
eukprot:GABV01000422.1.p1 GENE.GABV01000422.1~~GABV01000422.1.p1  ORF type:complete len:281 (+),score=63.37 GABV01000422.1:418-1260(+)